MPATGGQRSHRATLGDAGNSAECQNLARQAATLNDRAPFRGDGSHRTQHGQTACAVGTSPENLTGNGAILRGLRAASNLVKS